MWVADYVLMEYGTGAIMAVPAHDERDYEFATKFGLPIRRVIERRRRRAALHRATGRSSTPTRASTGMPNREALEQIVDWLDDAGPRPPLGQLPAARLAALAPALLGLPDPDRLLRRVRHRAGARRAAARRAARRRATTRRRAARRWPPRGLGQHDLPALRRPGAARDRHDGHLRRLVLVLPALLRRPQRPGAVGPRGARALDAGRPVHRRRRARDPAPDVRALLHQGARGHGPADVQEPFERPLHAGHDHARRGEDVQVEGQRDQPVAYIERYGADTARCYILFIGPPDQDADWSDEGVEGVHRFLAGCGGWAPSVAEQRRAGPPLGPLDAPEGDDLELLRKAHWAIEKVTNDMAGRFAFNTAIAAVMELVNECYRAPRRRCSRRRCTSPPRPRPR